MNIYPLYIDPGTGSALFAIIIGIAATVIFSFQSLLIKIKTIATGGRAIQGTKNKIVIYAEDKRYWSLFKPIVEELDSRNIELLYLTSSGDDPVFNCDLQYIKSEYIGEGNKAFARLNFLSADLVLSTTPGLDVYQWRRSKNVKHYCHIFHSPELTLGYELFGMDYYDSILLSAESDMELIRKLEKSRNLPEKQIYTVGCPYLDEFNKKLKQLPKEENHKFTVLVSPSWGKSALLHRFGEKLLDELLKTDWRIIVRPHPQSLIVEKELIEHLTKKYELYNNLEWDFNNENIYSINKADIMISDFSAIILDYMFLRNKPVFYAAEKLDFRFYDTFEVYDNYEDIWIFKTLKKTGIAINQDSFDKLPEQISKVVTNETFESEIKETKAKVWKYQGESAKYIADFIIKTID